MASVQSSQKSITSLKIHVDNHLLNKENKVSENNDFTNDDEEMEEGEASEDEIEVNVIVSKPISDDGSPDFEKEKPFTKSKRQEAWNDAIFKRKQSKDNYENFIEFQTANNDDLLEERASRFGIQPSEMYVPRKDLIKLYKSLDIDEDDFNRGGWRSDAVHMRGIEGMHKEDIFEYFRKYSPSNIEWLNSNSCNVVWLEKNGAARALLGLSCPIKPSVRKSIKNYTDDKRRKVASESERNNSKSQRPPAPLRNRPDKKVKDKTKSKSSSDRSNSSSSDSNSSDSEEDEKDNSSDSSSSDSSSSSNSSDDSSSSSSSSESGSSSDSSSDSEDDSTKMDTEKIPEVKTKTKLPSLPQPPPKDFIRVNLDNSSRGAVLDDGSVSMDDIGVPIPSGRWRLGVPCPYTKAIFLRFAHCKDKKVPGLKKPVELNKKYSTSKESSKYGGSPRRRHRRRSSELYKPEILDKNHRVPPLHHPRRNAPDFPVEAEDSGKFYQDLDDPFEDVRGRNPWGYLAQNWGQRETQDSLDYQALLREHISVKKRRPDFSESDEEDRHKRIRRAPREPDYSLSPPQDYDDVRMSDGSDDVMSWKSKIKLPRMRMYADVEEKKKVKRKASSSAVLNRIGSKSRLHSLHPRSENFSTNRNFDLRAKLQSKKLKERRLLRASYSESE